MESCAETYRIAEEPMQVASGFATGLGEEKWRGYSRKDMRG